MADSRDRLGKTQNNLRVPCSIWIQFKKPKSATAYFNNTYTKIGTVQRFSWPLYKDNMQIGEAFHISVNFMYILSELKRWGHREGTQEPTERAPKGQNQNNWIIT